MTALRERAEAMRDEGLGLNRALFDVDERRREVELAVEVQRQQADKLANRLESFPCLPGMNRYTTEQKEHMLTVLHRQYPERRPLVSGEPTEEQRELERINRRVEELERRRALYSERLRPVQMAVEHCRTWLQDRGQSAHFEVAEDAKLAGLSLDALRAMLGPIEQESSSIRSAPVPTEEALARVAAAIREAGESSLYLPAFYEPGGYPSLSDTGVPQSEAHAWRSLALVVPDRLQAAIEAKLLERYKQFPSKGAGAPIGTEARRARLIELEGRRQSIELYEERSVRRAWAADQDAPVIWRDDTRAQFIVAATVGE